MKLPSFPEIHQPSVRTLMRLSDRKLVTLLQATPDSGLYFVALYGRYAGLVYSLVSQMTQVTTQVEYLFALTWRTIFHALRSLDINELPDQPTLQSWFLDVTGICIHQLEIPPSDAIRYSLSQTPPPLWCYVDDALEQLPPKLRLLLVMVHTGQWTAKHIASYLKAEGEEVTEADIPGWIQSAYQQLEALLPEDLQRVYLTADA